MPRAPVRRPPDPAGPGCCARSSPGRGHYNRDGHCHCSLALRPRRAGPSSFKFCASNCTRRLGCGPPSRHWEEWHDLEVQVSSSSWYRLALSAPGPDATARCQNLEVASSAWLATERQFGTPRLFSHSESAGPTRRLCFAAQPENYGPGQAKCAVRPA